MIKLIKAIFMDEAATKEKLSKFILHADTLSMSSECQKFEASFAKKQGRKFAVLVSSGSAANLILVQALLNIGRIKKGDRIGFSALTWPTSVMPLIQLGLIPVPLDCALETLNVSPEILQKEIKNLRGLFLTNVLGLSDRIGSIYEMCKENNIVLIEDNCESLGSSYQGTLLGNFGAASTFSFYVAHHISLIEGGMVCTDDEELYYMLLMARAHGWIRNLPEVAQDALRKKYAVDTFYDRFTFYDLAYNLRPTEITGFLGNVQIQYWDAIVKAREMHFKRFHEVASKNPDFIPLGVDHMEIISNFAMPIVCKNKALFQKYLNRFKENGVELRPLIAGDMTRQPFYKKYLGDGAHCPNASFIHDNGFYFSNDPQLTEEEVGRLVDLLRP